MESVVNTIMERRVYYHAVHQHDWDKGGRVIRTLTLDGARHFKIKGASRWSDLTDEAQRWVAGFATSAAIHAGELPPGSPSQYDTVRTLVEPLMNRTLQSRVRTVVGYRLWLVSTRDQPMTALELQKRRQLCEPKAPRRVVPPSDADVAAQPERGRRRTAPDGAEEEVAEGGEEHTGDEEPVPPRRRVRGRTTPGPPAPPPPPRPWTVMNADGMALMVAENHRVQYVFEHLSKRLVDQIYGKNTSSYYRRQYDHIKPIATSISMYRRVYADYFEAAQAELGDARDWRDLWHREPTAADMDMLHNAFSVADAFCYYAASNPDVSCRHYDVAEYYPELVVEYGNSRCLPETPAVQHAISELRAMDLNAPPDDLYAQGLEQADQRPLVQFRRWLDTAYDGNLTKAGMAAPKRMPYARLVRQWTRGSHVRAEVWMQQPLPWTLGDVPEPRDYHSELSLVIQARTKMIAQCMLEQAAIDPRAQIMAEIARGPVPRPDGSEPPDASDLADERSNAALGEAIANWAPAAEERMALLNAERLKARACLSISLTPHTRPWSTTVRN